MGAPEYVIAMSLYIDNSKLGSGNRYVYWIGSDGVQSLVYDNSGQYNRHTLKNSTFSITKVFDSAGTELEFEAKDRLSYRLHPSVPWVDAGPLTVAGRRSTDPSLSQLKKAGVEASENVETSGDGLGDSDAWDGFEL